MYSMVIIGKRKIDWKKEKKFVRIISPRSENSDVNKGRDKRVINGWNDSIIIIVDAVGREGKNVWIIIRNSVDDRSFANSMYLSPQLAYRPLKYILA